MKDAAFAKEPSYDKWQAESDLRTLTEATAIKKDGKRMTAVKRAATEKLAEMAQLKQLAGKA